jgi:hypothetical protein
MRPAEPEVGGKLHDLLQGQPPAQSHLDSCLALWCLNRDPGGDSTGWVQVALWQTAYLTERKLFSPFDLRKGGSRDRKDRVRTNGKPIYIF